MVEKSPNTLQEESSDGNSNREQLSELRSQNQELLGEL